MMETVTICGTGRRSLCPDFKTRFLPALQKAGYKAFIPQPISYQVIYNWIKTIMRLQIRISKDFYLHFTYIYYFPFFACFTFLFSFRWLFSFYYFYLHFNRLTQYLQSALYQALFLISFNNKDGSMQKWRNKLGIWGQASNGIQQHYADRWVSESVSRPRVDV